MTTLMQLKHSPVLYSVTEETIATMRQRFASLKIDGLTDVAGYEAVHKARMECVKARGAVEKTRKELKAESLEYGRKVDAEAKRLTAGVQEIELRLDSMQDAIDCEKERLKREAEDAIYHARVVALAEYRIVAPEQYLRSITVTQFDEYLATTIQAVADKKARDAEEAAQRLERQAEEMRQREANRLEQERLKAERDEQARLAKLESDRLAADRATFEAEQRAAKMESDRLAKIQADKVAADLRALEQLQQEQAEREARLKKAEQDRLDAEQRERDRVAEEARKAAQAEADRVAAEAAAKRAEELKPVRERIDDFANDVENKRLPDVGDDPKKLIKHILDVAARAIRDVGRSLR